MIKNFRRYLVRGIIVIIPLVLTVLVIRILFKFFDKFIRMIAPDLVMGTPYDQYSNYIVLLFIIFIFIITGFISIHITKSWFSSYFSGLLEKIPVFGYIYKAFSTVINHLLGDENKNIGSPCTIEFTSDVSALGFVISTHEDRSCVFIPTSPNPTSGIVMIVSNNKIVPLRIARESFFTYIFSIGVSMNIRDVVPHLFKKDQDLDLAGSTSNS